MNTIRLWLWHVLLGLVLTLLWPGVFLVYPIVGLALSEQHIDARLFLELRLPHALVFLPMGLVSAVFLIALWSRTESHVERVGSGLGYLLASPFALFGAHFTGLLLPPTAGTLIQGALPLVGGTLAGYYWAKSKLRSLGWLWVVYSVMQALFMLVAFLSWPGGSVAFVTLMLGEAMQLPGLIGGMAAVGGRRWSVYFLVLAAVLNLIWVPVGTVLGLFSIVLLVHQRFR